MRTRPTVLRPNVGIRTAEEGKSLEIPRNGFLSPKIHFFISLQHLLDPRPSFITEFVRQGTSFSSFIYPRTNTYFCTPSPNDMDLTRFPASFTHSLTPSPSPFMQKGVGKSRKGTISGRYPDAIPLDSRPRKRLNGEKKLMDNGRSGDKRVRLGDV